LEDSREYCYDEGTFLMVAGVSWGMYSITQQVFCRLENVFGLYRQYLEQSEASVIP